MTRRERLERKLEKRQEWADKARGRAGERFAAADRAVEGIPFGQPILVGHHSEGRHRRAIERCHTNSFKGVEELRLAEYHEERAGGLDHLLDCTIFNDDPDAIEQLEARIAKRGAVAERYAAINKAWRKAQGDVAQLVATGVVSVELAKTIAETMAQCPWLRSPFDSSPLRASIRGDRERIATIRAVQAQREKAQQATAGRLVEYLGPERAFCRVTFAVRPDRGTLDALRAAPFRWNGTSWVGSASNLPAMLVPAAPEPGGADVSA